MRILIVDDAYVNRYVLKQLLLKLNPNYEIAEAINGQQAVLLCDNLHYDFIFMDMRMPVMDGITASKMIRKHYPNKPPFIIAVSGCWEKFESVDFCILKPIDKDRLFTFMSSFK